MPYAYGANKNVEINNARKTIGLRVSSILYRVSLFHNVSLCLFTSLSDFGSERITMHASKTLTIELNECTILQPAAMLHVVKQACLIIGKSDTKRKHLMVVSQLHYSSSETYTWFLYLVV